ncbi:MAG: FecR domain-containing protein [Bacteroidetes bacterium]|nr:FecR domain-containing protein [Bacteroidota bacterium]
MKSVTVALICMTFLYAGAQRAGSTPTPQSDLVGLLSKVILDVTWKAEGVNWEKANRGQTLSSGDMVKTGRRSLAVIKFKDNSLIRVRELTELTVTGTLEEQKFSKTVNVQTGGVGFNINTQQSGEEFRFTSPTSVASIRGTGGLFAIGSEDTLTVVEGLVEFQNTISTNSVDVPAGFTAFSRPDGSIDSRPSTPEERQAAEGAMQSDDSPRQLKLELRNDRGEVEELIIDFKEE